jgi:hypothetical protein
VWRNPWIPGRNAWYYAKALAGTHEDFAPKEAIETSSDRSFGVVFFVAFSLYGLWPLLREPRGVRLWALVTGGVFLLLGLVAPKVLSPLNKLWTKLGLLLGKIVNPIVMALLFFFTITPIGVLMRMMGKDGLRRRFDKSSASYWIERKPPGPPPESMKNQF